MLLLPPFHPKRRNRTNIFPSRILSLWKQVGALLALSLSIENSRGSNNKHQGKLFLSEALNSVLLALTLSVSF